MQHVDDSRGSGGAFRERSTSRLQADGRSAQHPCSQNAPGALPTRHDQPAPGQNFAVLRFSTFLFCLFKKKKILISAFSHLHALLFQDLFFKFTWNNFLHVQVEQCVSAILNQTAPDGTVEDSPEPKRPENTLADTAHAQHGDAAMFSHQDLLTHVRYLVMFRT